ncbi:hypothetical protein ACFL3V_02135 [Nanoarchaeota archaeon]
MLVFDGSFQREPENDSSLSYMGSSGLSEKLKKLEKGSIGSIELLVASEENINIKVAPGEKRTVVLNPESMDKYNITRGADGSLFQGGSPVHALFEEFYLTANVRRQGSDLLLVPEHHFHMDIKTVSYEPAVFNDASGRVNSDITDYALRNRHDNTPQPVLAELRRYVACVIEATGVRPSIMMGNISYYVPSEGVLDFLEQATLGNDSTN